MVDAFVLVLGSSSGVPRPDDAMPAVLVAFRSWYVLLDAGEGVQAELLKRGVGPSRISSVHVTHMHGDHVFGLPGLLQTMGMLSRSSDLVLQGPSKLKELVEASFSLTRYSPPFKVEFKECSEVVRFEGQGAILEVTCFDVCHDDDDSHGYAVVGYRKKKHGYERAFKVSYTGDTSPCGDYLPHVVDSDVLIHDATFSWEMREEALRFGHSTAKDAALVASESRSKLLVLFHRSTRYRGKEGLLLKEARAVHPNVVLASKGLTIVL